MSTIGSWKRYFSISVLFHVIVLTVLVASFDFSGRMPVVENADKDMKVINAVMLDAPLGPALPPKVMETPKKTEQLPPKTVAVEKKVAPLEKPKPKAIIVPDKHKKQRALLEKQLMMDLKKEEDKQKKIKHTVKQQALEKKMKADALSSFRQELAAEADQLARVQAQKVRGVVDKYKALILQAISYRWLVPPTINKELTCELLIRTAPGGLVMDVEVVKSSGDLALDRSARAAVFKASPLPVPEDHEAFEAFRQFILKVKPENIS